jgi:hypothetical protein
LAVTGEDLVAGAGAAEEADAAAVGLAADAAFGTDLGAAALGLAVDLGLALGATDFAVAFGAAVFAGALAAAVLAADFGAGFFAAAVFADALGAPVLLAATFGLETVFGLAAVDLPASVFVSAMHLLRPVTCEGNLHRIRRFRNDLHA